MHISLSDFITEVFVRVGDLGQPDILEPFSVCSQLSSDRPTSQLYGAATPASKSLPQTPRASIPGYTTCAGGGGLVAAQPWWRMAAEA